MTMNPGQTALDDCRIIQGFAAPLAGLRNVMARRAGRGVGEQGSDRSFDKFAAPAGLVSLRRAMCEWSILPLLLILLQQPLVGQAKTATATPALSPRQFAIMPWGVSPSDKAQLQLIKDAGFNISGFCLVKDLDLVASMGLSCFVTDNRAHVYNWKDLPPDQKIRANAAQLRNQIGSNPAVLGYLVQDEPSVSIMPGMGHVAALLRETMPDKWPFVNLLPTYAHASQMGAGTYWEYVQAALDNLHPPFLICDNYAVLDGQIQDRLYTNLEILRHYSLREKIPFWSVILTAKILDYMEPSDATLSVQVYSVLAYGGRGIVDFRYTPGQDDSTGMTAVDKSGNRTATWDMLRRINSQIIMLAPTLVRLHSSGVYHYPDVPKEGHALSESQWVSSVTMNAVDGANVAPRFLVGEFRSDSSQQYLMIVNKDLDNSFTVSIKMKNRLQKLFRVSSATGQERLYSNGTGTLAPGAGMLFRVQ